MAVPQGLTGNLYRQPDKCAFDDGIRAAPATVWRTRFWRCHWETGKTRT